MATNPISPTKSCAHLFSLDGIPLDVTKNISVKKLLCILLYLSILSLVESLLDSSVSMPYRYKFEFCAITLDTTSRLDPTYLRQVFSSLEACRDPMFKCNIRFIGSLWNSMSVSFSELSDLSGPINIRSLDFKNSSQTEDMRPSWSLSFLD